MTSDQDDATRNKDCATLVQLEVLRTLLRGVECAALGVFWDRLGKKDGQKEILQILADCRKKLKEQHSRNCPVGSTLDEGICVPNPYGD